LPSYLNETRIRSLKKKPQLIKQLFKISIVLIIVLSTCKKNEVLEDCIDPTIISFSSEDFSNAHFVGTLWMP
jgi:hypothetical protein